jgi:hypothetical protein
MAGGDDAIVPQRIAETVVNIAHSRKSNELKQSIFRKLSVILGNDVIADIAAENPDCGPS